MKGKFKVVKAGTGEKILESEEIAMESSGLSFRVYCPQRMEMKVMSLSPNDTVARCLADIERAFDKVTTNSSSYDQHYNFNNTLGVQRGLFCPKAQLLRIFTDAYSNSPASPVLSPLLPTHSDGPTVTSEPGGWSENRPRAELKPSQLWLQSSGNRWKPVQTARKGGVEMGRRKTANEADLTVPTPSPGSNGEVSQDDEDGASEATDSSTDLRENESDDDVDDIDDDDDVEEGHAASSRERKPQGGALQWSRSGLSVSSPTLPQGPDDWDKDDEEEVAAKGDGRGSERASQLRRTTGGSEGGEEQEEVLGRRNRSAAQLRRVNSVGLIKKGNDPQHTSGEERPVRTKHSNSRVQSMSVMGELQERMQKLKAEAKEHDKEEGVWLENSRMLIDYNFKHGTLLLLRLLPTESNPMKGSASAMTPLSMSFGSAITEQPPHPVLDRSRDSSTPSPCSLAALSELCSKAANELLTTERTYLSSLTTLIKVYVVPLQEQPFWTNSNAKKENSKSLFTILESIHAFHRHLLDQLEALMATYTYETQLGHVLVQMMPFLKLYSEYCSRYDKCTAELKKIFSSVIATRWLENCLNNDACHNLNIYAFLIMPVQRIPRYKMLIDLLIKHTPPDHGDYENLLQAQKKIVDVAQWVDSYKSNNDMMAELSGKIVGMGVPLMQAGRKFIFQGQLSKKPSSGKSGATTVRWFFLFSDVLIYAQEKKKAFVYKGSINLFPAKFNLCVEDLPLKKLSFQIVGKRKVLLVLIARTQQDKDNWMRELNSVLNTEDSPKSGGSTIRLKRG